MLFATSRIAKKALRRFPATGAALKALIPSASAEPLTSANCPPTTLPAAPAPSFVANPFAKPTPAAASCAPARSCPSQGNAPRASAPNESAFCLPLATSTMVAIHCRDNRDRKEDSGLYCGQLGDFYLGQQRERQVEHCRTCTRTANCCHSLRCMRCSVFGDEPRKRTNLSTAAVRLKTFCLTPVISPSTLKVKVRQIIKSCPVESTAPSGLLPT